MSKFRAAPQLQSEDAFIQAAESPRQPVKIVTSPAAVAADLKPAPAAAPQAKKESKTSVVDLTAVSTSKFPWEDFDADAKKTASQQPLRLNAYQYEQLKWLAETQDRSLAQILRRIVGPALDEAVRAQRE